jgi:hypothetical protein
MESLAPKDTAPGGAVSMRIASLPIEFGTWPQFSVLK